MVKKDSADIEILKEVRKINSYLSNYDLSIGKLLDLAIGSNIETLESIIKLVKSKAEKKQDG